MHLIAVARNFLQTSGSLIAELPRTDKKNLYSMLLLLENHRQLAVTSCHFLGSRRWANPGRRTGKKEIATNY